MLSRLLLILFIPLLSIAEPPNHQQEIDKLDKLFLKLGKFTSELYDAETGGFWESINDKKAGIGKPRLESTARAIHIIDKMDALNDLPSPIRNMLIKYIQSFQREDGWFDDPQEKRLSKNRLGRATGYATGVLKKLSSKPLHPLPGSNGINEKNLKHLESKETVYQWLDELAAKNYAWTVGSSVNGQLNVIKNLPEVKRDEVYSWLHSYLKERQAQDGFWWKGYPYNRLSGAFKVAKLYSITGKPMPNSERVYKSVLNIMRKEKASTGCFIRNPLHLLYVIEPQIKNIITEKEKREIALITLRNLKPYAADDGGFYMSISKKDSCTDGVSQAMKGRDGARKFAGLPSKKFPGKEDFLKEIKLRLSED